MYCWAVFEAPSGTPQAYPSPPPGAHHPLPVPARRVDLHPVGGAGSQQRRRRHPGAAAAAEAKAARTGRAEAAELERLAADLHPPAEDRVARLDRAVGDGRGSRLRTGEDAHQVGKGALQVTLPVGPGMTARSVVVPDVGDPEPVQLVVEIEAHRVDHPLDHVAAAEGSSRLAVAGADRQVHGPQVLRQVGGVVSPPANLLLLPRPVDRVRGDRDVRRVVGVDGPREAGGGGKVIGVARRVVHRPVAAHREPCDGPFAPLGERPVARVDEAEQLADVVALPLRRPEGAAVEPVDVAAIGPAVGHHHDQRPASGELLRVALVGPGAVVVERAVEQVENRAPPARACVGGGQQNADVGIGAEVVAAQGELAQPRVDPLRGDQPQTGAPWRRNSVTSQVASAAAGDLAPMPSSSLLGSVPRLI